MGAVKYGAYFTISPDANDPGEQKRQVQAVKDAVKTCCWHAILSVAPANKHGVITIFVRLASDSEFALLKLATDVPPDYIGP